jgi:hypothetical protein
MANKFLTPIGLPSGTANPVSAQAGELFYRSDLNSIQMYNGVEWSAQVDAEAVLDLMINFGVVGGDSGGPSTTAYNTQVDGGVPITEAFDTRYEGGAPTSTYIEAFDVADGSDGATGATGPTGPQGADSTIAGPTGPTGADGAGTPTGVDGQVQYNNSGSFGANASFTFDSSNSTLTVTNLVTSSIEPPSTLTGTYTISSPTTITLSPTDEIINAAPMKLVNKTVSQLGSLVASVGAMVFCTNASGGSIPAFYDGTDWRRVSDRVVVS